MTPALEHTRVRDIAHQGILSCPPDASLEVVARVMSSHRLHAVLVASPVPTAQGVTTP